MGAVEVDISMSLDGFVTGPDADVNGLGEGGEILHAWLAEPDGNRLLDEAFASSGAVLTSRKVCEMTGGWGEDGLYRMPVFVLTHRRHDVVVKGDTTFNFVTDGIESAVARARAAAGDKKVHVMGGASVVQQALDAGLVDQLHLPVAPIGPPPRHTTVRPARHPDPAGADRRGGIPVRHACQVPRQRVARTGIQLPVVSSNWLVKLPLGG